MRYLLDVNVLLAWGWSDHTDHLRVASWIAATSKLRGVKLLTSAIPELGFVRVSVQRALGRIQAQDAAVVLSSMMASLGKKHEFIPDNLSSTLPLPGWCRTASSTTDAHLVELARMNSAILATLDRGITNAFLLP